MLRVRNSLGSAHLCTDRSLCRQCGRRCGECNCGTPNDTASCTYDCRFRRGTSVSPRDIPGTCEKKKEKLLSRLVLLFQRQNSKYDELEHLETREKRRREFEEQEKKKEKRKNGGEEEEWKKIGQRTKFVKEKKIDNIILDNIKISIVRMNPLRANVRLIFLISLLIKLQSRYDDNNSNNHSFRHSNNDRIK
ncbi:hypothetical protein V1477_006006 [Vespula maculifrons]|uniref:Uncharacterized protein n=1 Tax=Vespula maculifrons TaxID=7453 RepID=A0ABD2CL75_VESMC